MLQRGVSGIGSVELAAQRNEAAGGGQPFPVRLPQGEVVGRYTCGGEQPSQRGADVIQQVQRRAGPAYQHLEHPVADNQQGHQRDDEHANPQGDEESGVAASR